MGTKKILVVGFAVVGILVAVVCFLLWQKSQPATLPQTVEKKETAIKKVDLESQPDWVKNLQVKVAKGISPNGLKNVTFSSNNLPKGQVRAIDYIIQYQTTNKGSQGALSTKPLEIGGEESFSKTIDLGTCSTKSCVTHDGVTSVELELDFTTNSSEKFSWTGTLSL